MEIAKLIQDLANEIKICWTENNAGTIAMGAKMNAHKICDQLYQIGHSKEEINRLIKTIYRACKKGKKSVAFKFKEKINEIR